MTFAELVNHVLVPIVDVMIIPVLYAFAFLFFLYGVTRYFFLEGEEGRKQGKDFVIWSLVGMVVLFTVWGFVKLLIFTFLEPTTFSIP